MAGMKKYLYLAAFKLMATLPVMAVICSYCGQEGHDEWDCPQNPNAMCPCCHVSGPHMPHCPTMMCPHCHVIMQGGNHRPDCMYYECPHCHIPMSGAHIPGCPHAMCPHCHVIMQGGNHMPDCPNNM
jgi:hypothetical protein